MINGFQSYFITEGESCHAGKQMLGIFSALRFKQLSAARALQAEDRAASNWPAQSHPIHILSLPLSLCVSLYLPLPRLTVGFFQSLQGHVRRATNSMSGRAELGAVGHLQAEMLHLELIDGADGYRGDKESSKASAIAPPPVIKDPAAPVTMDTYRPKRPTTLNLFPIVPRTQVEPELTLSTHTHTHT